MHTFTRCTFAAILGLTSVFSMAQPASDLASRIDASIAPLYKADAPGSTVIVTKDGKTVFRKAYGMADVSAKLGMDPDMSLRLGSITKQFTAVAILKLAEQGKLSVSDDFRKYLPDFPDKGKTITIEHLLTHSSGIPSYTGLPGFRAGMTKDVTVNELIATFKDLPLEFTPGERFAYNNSGYILLGAIIEKASGQRYADFVARQIFDPLGMKHTAYEGHERNKVPAARGHEGRDGQYRPAAALSMTQPYAAGSLVSTVDDLARWDAAITAGKLLKPASWKQAFTPYKLASGDANGYGYGWSMGKLKDSNTIAHGGGINGFSTYATRLPDEKVYVAVLNNSDSGLVAPEVIASKAAAIAIGKPFPEYKAIKLDAKALDAFVGTYKVDDKTDRVITREGDQLFLQRTGSSRQPLTPHSDTGFFVATGLTGVQFGKNAQGEVSQLTVTGTLPDSISLRTSAKPPTERVAITLAPGVFERYVGKYELRPGFVLDVRKDGDKYIGHATNQGPIEIFPQSPVLFFAKVIDAQLRFEPAADGTVPQLVLLQGGREMPGKRL